MTASTSPTPSFYDVEATEVYTDAVGFSVIEDPHPLPTLNKVVRSILSGVGAMATAVALTGVLTIARGETYPSHISQATMASADWGPEGFGIVSMTEHMRQRASLAATVFVKTPHPGADDPDPDYGF